MVFHENPSLIRLRRYLEPLVGKCQSWICRVYFVIVLRLPSSRALLKGNLLPQITQMKRRSKHSTAKDTKEHKLIGFFGVFNRAIGELNPSTSEHGDDKNRFANCCAAANC